LENQDCQSSHQQIPKSRAFSVRDQKANILVFADWSKSQLFTAIQLCCGRRRAATHCMQMGVHDGHGSVPIKHYLQAGHQWLTPVILATWETEIQRILVPGQPRQKHLQDRIPVEKG
jgi:hypothetical protein